MTDQKSPKKESKKQDDRKRINRPNLPPDDNFNWKKASRTLTIWALIVIGSWIIFNQLNLTETPEMQKSYSQYRRLIENGQFDSADIIDNEFHGRLRDGGNVITILPFIDANMIAEWDSLKLDYQFREKTTSWVGYLITSILPWVIIIAIWLYFIRRMQGGGGGQRGIFSFGKSKAKLLNENTRKVTFDDVAGCDEAKEELHEVIEFLQEPKKFSKLGGRIPTGALLLGPPGTGKTLLARAVAGEAKVPFYSMSGADFVEMFVGVGASRVRDLFEQGKKNAPCIIFIDEIDAVGRHRGAGLGGGHDEREQTLNQLLVEMDGFESNDGVILLAATNRPDVLDPALTRPGRFDRQIVVDRPDVRGREGILKVHTRDVPLGRNVKLETLAKGTPGLSGADLANLVNEAALLAARRNVTRVWMEDFESAKDKVMMGSERKSVLISKDEKRQTAFHEAGHVLVATLTPGADPVHKVTIIPRGRALGVTHYLPMDEKHSYSRTYLNQVLVALMGGRSAEKIIFDEFSTGAGNDIQRATDIARKMVCEWGMSDKLGPISLGSKSEEVFLGRDFNQQKNFSESTSQSIDAEVRRIVTDAEKEAGRLLKENTDKLNVIALALLEREILDGKEIDVLMKGGKLPPMRKQNAPKRPRRQPATTQPKKSVELIKKVIRPKDPPKRVPPSDGPKRESESGTSQTRRQLARDYGVVSSRDNQPSRYNHKPAPKPKQDKIDPPKKIETKSGQTETKTVDKSKFQRPILKKDQEIIVPPEKGTPPAVQANHKIVARPNEQALAIKPKENTTALAQETEPKTIQTSSQTGDKQSPRWQNVRPKQVTPDTENKSESILAQRDTQAGDKQSARWQTVRPKQDRSDSTKNSEVAESIEAHPIPQASDKPNNRIQAVEPKQDTPKVQRKSEPIDVQPVSEAGDKLTSSDKADKPKPKKIGRPRKKTSKTEAKPNSVKSAAKAKQDNTDLTKKVKPETEQADLSSTDKTVEKEEKPKKRRTYTRRSKAKTTSTDKSTDKPIDESAKPNSSEEKKTTPPKRRRPAKTKKATPTEAKDGESSKTNSPDLFSNSSAPSVDKTIKSDYKANDATGLFSTRKSPSRDSLTKEPISEAPKPPESAPPSTAENKDGN